MYVCHIKQVHGENKQNKDLKKRSDYFYNYNKIRRKRDTKKVLARKMVELAIKSGYLIKKPCEICGELNVEAHHDDYLKPLDVRWLCILHHKLHHFPIRKCSQCDRIAKIKGMCAKHYLNYWRNKGMV